MSVTRDGDIIRLDGDCLVEDAEPLTALLDGGESLTVDLAQCRVLHGAVLQTLLFYGPPVTGEPSDAFLGQWIAPILRARASAPRAAQDDFTTKDKDPTRR